MKYFKKNITYTLENPIFAQRHLGLLLARQPVFLNDVSISLSCVIKNRLKIFHQFNETSP